MFSRLQRSFAPTIAALWAIVASSLPLAAQEIQLEKPALVIAVKPVEQLTEDITGLLRSVDAVQYSGLVPLVIGQYTNGLDNKRPIGVSVFVQEQGPPVVIGMLPVADPAAFYAGLANAGVRDDLGNGRSEITIAQTQIYTQEKDQWLYIAQFENQLDSLNIKADQLFGAATKNYTFSVTAFVENVPEALRDRFIAEMQAGYERAIDQQIAAGQLDEDSAEQARSQIDLEQIKEIIRDTKRVFFGIAFDSQVRALKLDTAMEFVAGSRSAKSAELQKNLTSRFAQVAQVADPIQLRYTAAIDPSNNEMIENNLEKQRAMLVDLISDKWVDSGSTDDDQLAEDLVDLVFSGFKRTAQAGKWDGAYSGTLEGGVTVIGVGTLVDAAQTKSDLETFLQKYSAQLEIPAHSPVTIGSLNGYRIDVPVPADEEDMQAIVGSQLSIIVLFGDDMAALGIGHDPAGQLESSLARVDDQSSASVPPAVMSVEALPLLKFAESIAENPEVADRLRMIIERTEALETKDAIRIEGQPINNGSVTRVTIEEGVLKAISTAVQANNPAAAR